MDRHTRSHLHLPALACDVGRSTRCFWQRLGAMTTYGGEAHGWAAIGWESRLRNPVFFTTLALRMTPVTPPAFCWPLGRAS